MSTTTAGIDVPSGEPARIPTPEPGDARLARLSLNQRSIPSWSVREAVDGCVRAGVPAIGLWREPVAETGLDRAARMVADAGLRVSSLCRGGFLTDPDPAARGQALDDNRAAIDEAAALGTDTLVLVVGGLPEGSRDLPGARRAVVDALGELVPYARERGVSLALEPMHPIFCADRGVLSTLGQALDMAEPFAADEVTVVVDAFHVWWDPALDAQLTRAAGRIASYQVGDWITPLPADTLCSRGIPGDGHIDLAGLTSAVAARGYRGDVEVEVFNQDLWAADGADALATIVRRYAELVAPHL
ncbi:sugar phosphate isomerase/epimerase family protein [Pseudonocardia sp. HH130630-07]|uniref:sugar phosphate isomerase/epimerase family protein n=1 Tax=Pseudonocardia sp. HH130630-07 TaxID=1690815 RepID=UPI0008152A3D|nr:sugar phosphate isomerase/epimerase family protein [Pseudonocardia sp. HH130630-07]ANY07858.1 xylose isomerase [Pseudonocardia sp. HH130630-07]